MRLNKFTVESVQKQLVFEYVGLFSQKFEYMDAFFFDNFPFINFDPLKQKI